MYEFVVPPHSLIVSERNEAGKAHLEVAYPDGAHCIVWFLEKTGYFQFLQGDKDADGIFFVCHSDDRVDAYIIECKKTMTNSSWEQAKKQLQESLTKVLAIAGVLGIEINRVCLGAAFRESRLDSTTDPEPRVAVGVLDMDPADTSNTQINARARELAEWRTGEVKLRGFAKPFPLTKIQLDPQTGHGSYALPNP
ncbi:MAG TPA: hypothetical protein PK156_43870 [Polyangium sp.]|nr:hypothetical protein [Polyangium sp.]